MVAKETRPQATGGGAAAGRVHEARFQAAEGNSNSVSFAHTQGAGAAAEDSVSFPTQAADGNE